MQKSTLIKSLSLSAAFTLSTLASGSILAQYNFNDEGMIFADSANESGITASDIIPGAALALNDGRSTGNTSEGAGSYFSLGSSIGTGLSTTSASWDYAKTNGLYLEFTLTPDSGQSLNLTDLRLDVGYDGTNEFRFAATSSLTGFDYNDQLTITTENATDAGSLPNILQSNLNGMSNIPSGVNQNWGFGQDTLIDLSSPTFSNITSAVTFRLYAFKINSANVSDILRLDNVILNGAVIPEPGSFVLLFGAFALLAILAKRK
ncbi:hypothetical protein P0Y35_05000 [Kiritimatiellaeota bacterium B1221]|nr:hypothetical protein [Kiritimatiellaeota bacterium B1221]